MLTELLLLAAAGLAAGVVNTLAGGGSLLALPALIFAGLPADVANATNRVGVVLQSAVATKVFYADGKLELRRDAPLIAATMLGALLGALISLQLDADGMRWLIGAAMLAMTPLIVFKPTAWLEAPEAPQELRAWHALLFLAIGLYGGLMQAGVGVFLLSGLILATGREAVSANAAKVLMVLLFTLPALALYAWSGLISLPHGLALAAGSSVGGWLGSQLGLRGGAKLIRAVLVLVVLASGSKLLGLW